MQKNTKKILAIDAGTTESGYAIMTEPDEDDLELFQFGKIKNEDLLQIIKTAEYNVMVYEQFQCFGMAVGESTIESITWNGRFIQAALDKGVDVMHVYRKEEKLTLCQSLKAKDANIKQALIDRYAKKDKVRGKGTKKEPDVFFGVSKDAWSAIAVGVTWSELEEDVKEERKK